MTNHYDWRGYAQRLRLVRLVFGITEVEAAAAAHGVTLRTYRKWELGDPQHSTTPLLKFSKKYRAIDFGWLLTGKPSVSAS